MHWVSAQKENQNHTEYRDVVSFWNKEDFHPLTWLPSPLASQQGQLDVVHACAPSGPWLALWLQLCVVSAVCVSVGALNASYSAGCMGVKDCPPLVLFKGLFPFLKPKGEEKGGGGGLSLCQAPLYTPLFSLFSLSLVSNIARSPSIPSQFICFPSFFTLECLYISFLSLLPPTERLLKGHAWLNLLCNSGTVTVVQLQ